MVYRTHRAVKKQVDWSGSVRSERNRMSPSCEGMYFSTLCWCQLIRLQEHKNVALTSLFFASHSAASSLSTTSASLDLRSLGWPLLVAFVSHGSRASCVLASAQKSSDMGLSIGRRTVAGRLPDSSSFSVLASFSASVARWKLRDKTGAQ